MPEQEEPLTGGNVADSVVRVGSTVRKLAVAATPAVEALLDHLAAVGFDGAPKTLGRDDQGRHVLEYVPGETADAGPPMRLWDLAYAVHGFLPMTPDGVPETDAPRIRAMADGYGLDEPQRRALPALMVGHTRDLYELLRRGWETGEQPWHRLYAQGHGAHWGPVSDYIEAHRKRWTEALLD